MDFEDGTEIYRNMTKNRFPTFALAALVALTIAAPVSAEICAIDDVPAATLLLPYFEVDLGDDEGVNTLFSINNASASATLAHVVFWTDWSAPTIDFDLYLTGYDVQTINLRDVFAGNLPITASDGQDLLDTISPQGPISQDINFASCNGFFPFVNPVVSGTALDRLVNGHTGNPLASLGGRCLGDDHGDDIARGYVTVDVANSCSLVLDPSTPGYFLPGGSGIAGNRNILWGDFFYINPGQNFAQGMNLVHIEAEFDLALTNDTGYTFYGRYTDDDDREPLGTTWGVRYLNGGQFTGGTDLIVWRDSTANNLLPAGAFCNVGPDWFPLNETQVIAFDEQEDAVALCDFQGGVISPPEDQDNACFPYEAGRYAVADFPLDPPFTFGWLYLNLNLPPDAPTGDVDFGADGNLAQSWVAAVHDADGRFSVGLEAIEFSDACQNANILFADP